MQKNIALACYTSIQVGGTADFVAFVQSQRELIELHQFCRKHAIRLIIIGHGTNIFFPENGIRGVVAILQFDRIKLIDNTVVQVEAGAPLSALNDFCLRHHLAGFEFASGIPGTVGGAIYGNAGAYGKNIGQCLTTARLLFDSGEIKVVGNDFLEFGYRDSILKRIPAIVLEAEIRLEPGGYAEIKRKIDDIIAIRNVKLPAPDIPTAGSYFKNLKDENGNPIPAAKYLDEIGSKQISVGDAAVHHKHANIFYNKGNAKASQILELERILRQKVYERFGIELEREVIYMK